VSWVIQALIDTSSNLGEETGIRMVALFDHEEVGSDSAQGAGSPVLIDALRRITSNFGDASEKVCIITNVIRLGKFLPIP
jgi:aspartyl aminopeptidase